MPSPAVERVLARVGKYRYGGNVWRCRCPAHEDKSPSLVIKEGSDGRVLLHCHAGCATVAILRGLRLNWSALFTTPPARTRNARRR